MVQYSTLNEMLEPHAISNPIIASYITAYVRTYPAIYVLLSIFFINPHHCRFFQARLELLKGLEKLGSASLYWDTDSIFHISKPGWPILEEGPFFGQYKSELKPNEIITKWVSLGPKTFAYLTSLNREELRTKGISLDWITNQLFNFDSMADVLLGHTDDLLEIYDQLQDQELAERLRFTHEQIVEKSKRKRTNQIGAPSADTVAGANPASILIVPTSRIKKDVKSARIQSETGEMKRVQLQFKKRRICARNPFLNQKTGGPWTAPVNVDQESEIDRRREKCWDLGGALRTVPWGYVFKKSTAE